MRRFAVPLLLAAVLAIAGAGLVRGQSADARGKGTVRAGLLRVAADYVGLTPRDLLHELRAGRSLAQVAEARGKTRNGLKAALLAAVEARLDRAVASGRVTAAQHAQLLPRAEQRIARLVDRTNLRAGRRRALELALLRAAAQYVGVTPRQLVREFRAGGSLAEIAAAHGKTREGLKAALLTAIERRLDRLVAAGRITSDRKAAVLSRAGERVERLLDRKRAR